LADSDALFCMIVRESEGSLEREALVLDALSGRAGGRENLLRAIWPDAYRIAWSVLRNHVAAEDAAQDACAKVIGSLEQLRRADAFRMWFYRIVVRCALRYRATPVDSYPQEPALGASIEDRVDLADAVLALPREMRITVVLRYYHGLNASEIAEVTGAPSGTVRFRLAMARRRLARHLTPEGHV
jgi:RNA polymerase sigma-70 factor (ECF subfamily)